MTNNIPYEKSTEAPKRQSLNHSPLTKFFREPLIHFFILGLVVFGLYGIWEREPEAADDPFLVEVSSADIEWFRTMWSKRMGREPTVEELRGMVHQLIREQILSREAVSLGLDAGDTVVRRRLAQKMDFLFQDLSDMAEPSEEELKAYLQEHGETYEIPSRVTFTHIYFNTDKRGEENAADAARQIVARLNSEQGAFLDVPGLGDPFLLQAGYSNKSMAEVDREFGHRFAQALWEQTPGKWYGPVASGYGLHAVYVKELKEARLPDIDDLKEKLKADWMADKQRQLARKAYETVRGRYRVLLEGMPYNLDLGG